MIVKRYSIKITSLVAALALSIGCSVDPHGDVTTPLEPKPVPGVPDDDHGNGDLKNPIPIKPRRNPGSKIERPKFIDDIMDRIFPMGSVLPYSTLAEELDSENS